MPDCFQIDEPGKKKTWFRTKCVDVLQDFVGISPVIAFEFSPAVPVDTIPAELLRQVQSFHVPLIDQAVEESFQDGFGQSSRVLAVRDHAREVRSQ